MKPVRIKAAVVALLMALAFAGANAWRPTQHMADQHPKVQLETMFPKGMGQWAIDDRMPVQLVSPDTAALLNKIYNQTLSRTYINPSGDRIMLSVAYGGDQSDGTRAHRPEVCYPAQGFQILSGQGAELALQSQRLRVRQLVAKQGGRIEPITYWTIVGQRVAISGTEQKLAQLSYTIRGVIPDGMLVRVSSIGSDAGRSFKLHQEFIDSMVGAVSPQVRVQIVGAADV